MDTPFLLLRKDIFPSIFFPFWVEISLKQLLVRCKLNVDTDWSRERENLASFVEKTPTHGNFDVEISLAKGIIFKNIGRANSGILKQWVAHPYLKFSREPPPLVVGLDTV